jgi:hypothetical protein
LVFIWFLFGFYLVFYLVFIWFFLDDCNSERCFPGI